MSKTGTPIILDNWLNLLSQLDTQHGKTSRVLCNQRGKRFQPFTFSLLRDAGLIQSTAGKYGGYQLRYPLTDIPFSVLVNLWSLSSHSYIRRLFLHYGHLSLATVCQLPVTTINGYVTSLDSVCHVIRAMRYNEFISAQYFYPALYTPSYGAMIARNLKQIHLAIGQPGKGYALLKRQDEIVIGDIIPVVSNRCQTLSRVLLLAQNVSVAKLFK